MKTDLNSELAKIELEHIDAWIGASCTLPAARQAPAELCEEVFENGKLVSIRFN